MVEYKDIFWKIILFQYHYTFTSFDVETLDLEDFKYNQVNITSFRYENSKLKLIPQVGQILKWIFQVCRCRDKISERYADGNGRIQPYWLNNSQQNRGK